MQTQDRLHSLDAVRAFALLGGIVLHATMSFFIALPVADNSQSVTLGLSFYVIHMFRMVTFFMIAGFFGRMMMERKGVKGFVKDRSKRILIPMVAGWIILAPLVIGMVIWGAIRTYGPAVANAPSPAAGGLPLVHLWFLYYLAIFYMIAVAMRGILHNVLDRAGVLRTVADAVVRFALRSDVALILLAAPMCAVLYYTPTWTVWFGIPTPDVGLSLKLPAMIAFGTAFGFGWVLQRQTDLLAEFEKRGSTLLLFAVALTCVCLAIAGITPSYLAKPTIIPGSALMRLGYAASYSLATWCWTFAVIGLAMRFMSNHSPVRRYLADASYWLYLIHLPIIFFLQVAMAKWDLTWMIKFPLILGITMGIGLVTYRYVVRYTFIGATLNGKRFPRQGQGNRPAKLGHLAEHRSS
jgi:glucan biosynthesis protein C